MGNFFLLNLFFLVLFLPKKNNLRCSKTIFKMTKKIRLLILFVFASIFSFAQTIYPATINTSGGRGTIGTKEYEYSIGEMTVVSTLSSSNVIVTHGVLQPIQQNAESISETIFAKLNLEVFPNPTQGIISIQTKNSNVQLQNIQVLDITGKLIENIACNKNSTSSNVDVTAFASGNYILQINSLHQSKPHQNYFTIQKK